MNDKEMTTEEMKIEKTKLEQAISNILHKFHVRTGWAVNGVQTSFRRISETDMHDLALLSPLIYSTEVTITNRLPEPEPPLPIL